MSNKKKNTIKISFDCPSGEHVTGSNYYIETGNYKILLECGLAQSNNVLNDYRTNNQKFNYKVKEIDYIFLMDRHADHTLRTPLLYKRGCQATIVVPTGATRIFKDMLIDCVKINQRDAEYLSKVTGRKIEPLYDEGDVYNTLSHVVEYNHGEKIELNEEITFKFLHSGHVITAASLELWLKNNNQCKKIYYSSDLGNLVIPKNYVEEFQPTEKANLAILESTYSDSTRHSANLKDRQKDLEKIKQIIEETCITKKGKVLIPVFALDRAPEMLTAIYDIFGKDESFNIPVLLDSPLMLKHFKSYFNILQGEKLEKLNRVMAWKNIIQIGDWTETKHWAENGKPCIVLASSGQLTAGRALTYLPYVLSDYNSHIIFCGYSSENSLAWKIKNGKDDKFIKIDDKMVRNRCPITSLTSFSSHIQYKQMLEYYSNITADKYALVHGQMSAKVKFAQELQSELSKKNKTGRVIAVNSSTVINL